MYTRKPKPRPKDTRLQAYASGLKRGKRIALANMLDLFDDLRAAYEMEHCYDMWDFFEALESRLDEVVKQTERQF